MQNNKCGIAVVSILVIILISPFLGRDNNAFAADYHQHHDHSQQTPAVRSDEISMDLETQPATLKAGMPADILFTVKDSKGKPVQELTVTHERLLHVVIIGEDFSVFSHIHPEDLGQITPDMKTKGQFPARYTFPKAGQYLISVDYAVKGAHLSEHFSIDVDGEPKMGSYKKDLSREKRFGDYYITLTPMPESITAGREITLKYFIKKNGEKVSDLEPYLAAPMHIAIVMADLNNFVHVHGEVPGTSSIPSHSGHEHGNIPAGFGPEIEAHVVFPVKGIYQIFSEFKHRGKVIVSHFMLEVE